MSQDYMSTGTSGAGSDTTGSTSGYGAQSGMSGSGYGQQGQFGQQGGMQDAMRTTQERMMQAREFVANQAAQRPMVTTAVALGAGVLLGMMMGGAGAQRR